MKPNSKRIWEKITNNWMLKLFSLATAFFLWVLVMTIENPEDQKTFYNIPVKLVNTEVLTDKDMVYEVLNETNVVPRVTITASKTVRDDLNSSDIIAEADFSKITVTNTVEINFYSQRYGEQISNIKGSNEILKLHIEEKKTKRLPLDVITTGEVANGYIIYSKTPDQNRIEISGPESVISKVYSAKLMVDVTNSTSDISTYSDVVLYDVEGNEISHSSVSMNAASVSVKVRIFATKEVPVRCSVMGVPAEGYLYTGNVVAEPARILIAGPEEVIGTVRRIEIPAEALNITGQAENMISYIDVVPYLPEGTVLGDSSYSGKIAVTAYIEPETARTVTVPGQNIKITGVPEGYRVEMLNADSLAVAVKGLEVDVNGLNGASLVGVADYANHMEALGITADTIIEGIYDVEIQFTLPNGITVTEPVKAALWIVKMEEL